LITFKEFKLIRRGVIEFVNSKFKSFLNFCIGEEDKLVRENRKLKQTVQDMKCLHSINFQKKKKMEGKELSTDNSVDT
jgi:esterase/lipase superfamily enzyme